MSEEEKKTVMVIGKGDEATAKRYSDTAKEAGVPSRITNVGEGQFRVDVGPADQGGFLRFWDAARRRGVCSRLQSVRKTPAGK